MSFYKFVNIDDNFTDEPMDGVGGATADGKINAVGGWNGLVTPSDRNTHYTFDGTTKAKLANAPFNPCHSHGLRADKNGKIWKVGSDAQSTTTAADRGKVYNYTEADGWQFVNSFTELEDLVLFAYEIWGSRHIIIGGHRVTGSPGAWTISAENVSTIIYISDDDFQTLQIITESAPVGGIAYGHYKVYQGFLYGTCMGSVYDDAPENRVYGAQCKRTVDLMNWADLPDFPGEPRQYARSEVWDRKLFFFNGVGAGNYNLQEAWYFNRYNWAKIAKKPLTATHAMPSAVLNNECYLFCGNINSQLYKLIKSDTP